MSTQDTKDEPSSSTNSSAPAEDDIQDEDPHPLRSILLRVALFLVLVPVILLFAYTISRYQDREDRLNSGSPNIGPIVSRFTAEDLANRTSPLTPDEPTLWDEVADFWSTLFFITIPEMLMGLVITYFIICPIGFFLLKPVQHFLVFGHCGCCSCCLFPPHDKYQGLQEMRIENQRDRVWLGVWHFPPQLYDVRELKRDLKTWKKAGVVEPEQLSKKIFARDRSKVVLYVHGTGGNRSFSGSLYRKMTSALGYHVVAFDPRGYADSTMTRPTVPGVASDLGTVYHWLLKQDVEPTRIIIWGHSLGTGIVMRMLGDQTDDPPPLAAILEGAFTNMADLLRVYPSSMIFRLLPYFECAFVNPIVRNPELNFDSLAALPRVRCPLLIMHAEDDCIIPIRLGRKLFNQAKLQQPRAVAWKTAIWSLPKEKGYGHNKIISDKGLHRFVRNYIYFVRAAARWDKIKQGAFAEDVIQATIQSVEASGYYYH